MTLRPPEMVDVALVDVALNDPKVGVEVATTRPEELVERRELIAAPERVSDGAEMEEVATNFDAVTVPPSKKPLPSTDKVEPGVVVPMPTLPAVK